MLPLERRLKTPGKLYRLSKRLDKLEHSVSELSPKDMQKEPASIRAELESVTKDMSPSEKSVTEPGNPLVMILFNKTTPDGVEIYPE